MKMQWLLMAYLLLFNIQMEEHQEKNCQNIINNAFTQLYLLKDQLWSVTPGKKLISVYLLSLWASLIIAFLHFFTLKQLGK